MIPSRVTLVEVGPRDGLQNEKEPVGTDDKVELVHRLQAAGLREIEVTSFVSPKWVPQMADNAQVMAGIRAKARRALLGADAQHEGVRGGAAAASPTRSWCSAPPPRRSASATSTARSPRASIASRRGRGRARGRHQGARRDLVRARLPVPGRGLARRGGARGAAAEGHRRAPRAASPTPSAWARRARCRRRWSARSKHYPLAEVSGHFHDTYGQALANIYACLEIGVPTFDASVAGLGGCPYAKGATGNVATEDVVYMLRRPGHRDGIDLDALVDAGAFISERLGRPPVSRVGRALLAKRGRCCAADTR